MKLSKDIQIAPNFTFNEFLHSDDKQMPSIENAFNMQNLAIKLQYLRNIVGSITVNSGFRGEKYNSLIGGSKNSYHLQGLAADIKFNFKGWTRESLTKLLQSIGFTNVNFYWTSDRKSWVWLHVDIGKTWDGKDYFYRDLDSVTQNEISL